jgi:hypothetical protein
VQSQTVSGGRGGEGKLENTILVLDHDNHLRKKLSRYKELENTILVLDHDNHLRKKLSRYKGTKST